MLGRRRNIIIRFFTSQIFISLLLLAILAVLVLPMIRDYRQRSQVNKEIIRLKAEIAQAEAQNTDFRKMIEYLESEQFVEEQARLNLGLKKPGEKVIVVQGQEKEIKRDETEVIPDQPLIASQALMMLNNFKKWSSYFFQTVNKKAMVDKINSQPDDL